MIRDLMADRTATPQVLARVGITPEGELPAHPTPRRPLSDVLRIRS
jgi:hypothetical protein